MLKPLIALLALTTLAIATAGCGAAMREGSTTDARTSRPTAFEAWAVGNGTGAFFKAVGPAGGTGVRHGWPE